MSYWTLWLLAGKWGVKFAAEIRDFLVHNIASGSGTRPASCSGKGSLSLSHGEKRQGRKPTTHPRLLQRLAIIAEIFLLPCELSFHNRTPYSRINIDKTCQLTGTVRGPSRRPHFSLAIISVTVQLWTYMFWVISVYFNIRNTLPNSGTFLLGHPVYEAIPRWYEALSSKRTNFHKDTHWSPAILGEI